MRVLWVRRRSLGLFVMFSITAVVLNIMAIRYLVTVDEIEQVNLSSISGHCIAIDPGHGGIDDGARANGIVEKELNLAIALKLAETLRVAGAAVVMTRESDIDYYTRGKGGKRNDLLKRVEIMEKAGAELFVSIHANTFGGGTWSGAQVFYSPKLAQSQAIAEVMQKGLKNFPPGNKRQAKQDLDILVLNAPNIPGVLVETGFITNKREAQMLSDADYQQKLADQIANALAYHFSHNVGR